MAPKKILLDSQEKSSEPISDTKSTLLLIQTKKEAAVAAIRHIDASIKKQEEMIKQLIERRKNVNVALAVYAELEGELTS